MTRDKVTVKWDFLSDKCCFTMKITGFSVLPLLHGHLLPPAMKLGQGYVFTRVCDSVHRGRSWSLSRGVSIMSRGVSITEGSLSWGSPSRGSLSRGSMSGGVSVWGVSVPGDLCPGGFCLGIPVQGVSVWGISVQGVSVWGVSVWGISVCLGGLYHRDPLYGNEHPTGMHSCS